MTNQELEYRALKILEQQPDLTQRQLAEALGVSLGKTHYLVKSLIDVGWVKLDNFQRSDNKWGYAYLLTPKGIVEKAAITARFLVRKKQEFNNLQLEIQQLQEEVRQQQDLSKKWIYTNTPFLEIVAEERGLRGWRVNIIMRLIWDCIPE